MARKSSISAAAPLLILLGLALLLDSPAGRPFNGTPMGTDVLGSVYFESLQKVAGLPGVSLSIFECASLLLFVRTIGRDRSPNDGRLSKMALFLVLLIPLLVISGTICGLFYGNSLPLILTQTRAMASLPIWFVIGYFGCVNFNSLWGVYAVVAGCMAIKSIQAIIYYAVILRGEKGSLEYVVEHLTSDFLSTAVLSICAFFIVFKSKWVWRGVGLCAGLLMSYVFLINDRRAALVGVGLSGVTFALAMPSKTWRKIWPHAAITLLGLMTFLAVTWQTSGTLGFAARTIKSLSDPSESSAGYRRIENANLLSAIEAQPLTGIGFGRRFDLVFPMPDISGIYSEFDLIPHNTLLFIWTFAGPLGIASFGTFIAVSIGVVIRAMRQGDDLETSVLATLSLLVVVKSLAYIFADLGLREVRLLSFVGLIVGASLRLFHHKSVSNFDKIGSPVGGTVP